LFDPEVCEALNPVPVIVIVVPGGPLAGDTLVTTGGGTVNTTSPPWLETPATVTTTLPVPAGSGTPAVIRLSDQVLTVAGHPAICRVDEPCVAPNPLPFTVTGVRTGPLTGEIDVTKGLGTVNKTSWLLAMLLTTTFTGPVVVPDGIVATIWLSDHVVIVVGVAPLKVIELEPFAA